MARKVMENEELEVANFDDEAFENDSQPGNSKIIIVEMAFHGTTGLLMHNERLANPFDPITKEIATITSRRKKTEEDNLRIHHLEWEGGLYFSEEIGPYIPGANVKKCIMESAKVNRGGTSVKRGLTPMDAEIPLLYDGPRTIDGMWKAGTFIDVRSVRVKSGKVSRARPCFRKWALHTRMYLNLNIIDMDDLRRYIHQAGLIEGLGEYRPTYGRFTGQVSEWKED